MTLFEFVILIAILFIVFLLFRIASILEHVYDPLNGKIKVKK